LRCEPREGLDSRSLAAAYPWCRYDSPGYPILIAKCSQKPWLAHRAPNTNVGALLLFQVPSEQQRLSFRAPKFKWAEHDNNSCAEQGLVVRYSHPQSSISENTGLVIKR